MSDLLLYPRPCVVVSQPMYFPWVGMLQQIRLCDSYVFYDDVQFSKGSLFNRVQIKTEQGIRWLTVPLCDRKIGQMINEVKIDSARDWKRSHLGQLKNAYKSAKFGKEMLDVVDDVFSNDYDYIGDLSAATTEALAHYFPTLAKKKFLKSSSLAIPGASSQKVIDVCLRLGAGTYITGHGARNYLDHAGFEDKGIAVAYIDYGLNAYSQLHGKFTPYVSALDLIANCGKTGVSFIQGELMGWREFTMPPG